MEAVHSCRELDGSVTVVLERRRPTKAATVGSQVEAGVGAKSVLYLSLFKELGVGQERNQACKGGSSNRSGRSSREPARTCAEH